MYIEGALMSKSRNITLKGDEITDSLHNIQFIYLSSLDIGYSRYWYEFVAPSTLKIILLLRVLYRVQGTVPLGIGTYHSNHTGNWDATEETS